MDRAPRVFLSYSHDSDAHRERVLALSERLRHDGIDIILDQYTNGSPAEGWPRWMLDRLDESDRVLLICTPTYYRRFRGHAGPGKGKGVDWEGAIITQAIYDARSRVTRFIPVLFNAADATQIPEPLRSQSHYCLTTEAAYQSLYDALLDQAGVEPGELGSILGRERELEALDGTWADSSRTAVVELIAQRVLRVWGCDSPSTSGRHRISQTARNSASEWRS
jgi:hypothetical protein